MNSSPDYHHFISEQKEKSVRNFKTFVLFVWFDSLHPINNLSVIKGQVFLGWTSTKLGLMFLLKDTTQWRRWGSNPRPFGLESSTLPLSHCAPEILKLNFRTLTSCLPKGLDKEGRPRSDCFWRSSLILVFPVCYSDKQWVHSSRDYHQFICEQKEKCSKF